MSKPLIHLDAQHNMLKDPEGGNRNLNHAPLLNREGSTDRTHLAYWYTTIVHLLSTVIRRSVLCFAVVC